MSDENNQAAGQGTDLSEEQKTTDVGTEDKGVSQDKGQGGKDTETKTGEGIDKAKAPADTSEQDDDKFEDDGVEPTVKRRMSSKDFIIQRQQRKIAQFKEDKKTDDGTNENESDDIAPEDEALITKVIAKKFAPLIDKTQGAEDKREVSEFLAKNPDFKPFEAKAIRYIAHPSRRHMPIESIFYEVAGKALLRIGAKRQVKADEEARKTQTGGGSGRGGGDGKGNWNLSKDEFEVKQEKLRRQH